MCQVLIKGCQGMLGVLSSDARNASRHIKGVCLSLVGVCQGLSDREGL